MEGIREGAFVRLLLSSIAVLFLLLAMNPGRNFRSEAAKLPDDEVAALKTIASKLGKKDWNFSVDPCSGKGGWVTDDAAKASLNRVTCNCTFANGTLCHIVAMSLMVNRFSGPIPKELGNITTLQEMQVPNIHDILTSLISEVSFTSTFSVFVHLQCRTLEANKLAGTLPPELGNLTMLNRWTLNSNQFTGGLPSTLSKLVNLNDMMIMGTSLEGPLPPSISAMRSLIELDLSFNNLTGQIPPQFSSLSNMKDLVPNCVQKDFPCTGSSKYSSLYINCGGTEHTVDGITNEADMQQNGDSTYFISKNANWALSSTGWFMDAARVNYIKSNQTRLLFNDPTLYMAARTTSITMTYYGLCLQSGSYNVQLHFAEIMFTDDKTFSSLGERVFDVYVQHQIVLKDFNIESEAGGPGRKVIKSFDVNVTDTLEISFYWAGKGTLSVPSKGVYGPLISAISVTSNFVPRGSVQARHKITAAKIIVIVIACFLAITFFVLVVLWWKGCLGSRRQKDEGLRCLEKRKLCFSLKQINEAVQNFDPANKIGEGGFGSVYKGVLPDGRVIAVKQLAAKSKQGNKEFLNEICMISTLQHPNLVKLYGCCTEGSQLMLVYEYLENNSLANALFGRAAEDRLKLNWPTRYKICIGVARGLAYLHEESMFKIVHRDIKSANILLDKKLNAKISDFGLAKLDEGNDARSNTRIVGTVGYMAPEYATRGHLTDKADVYSFGLVVLEIVSGESNSTYLPREKVGVLLERAYELKDEGNLLELVDPTLGKSYSKEEALRMLSLALLCTNQSPMLRPTMSTAVEILEGKAAIDPASLALTRQFTDSTHPPSGCYQDSISLSESMASSYSTDKPSLWIDSSETNPSIDRKGIVSSEIYQSDQSMSTTERANEMERIRRDSFCNLFFPSFFLLLLLLAVNPAQNFGADAATLVADEGKTSHSLSLRQSIFSFLWAFRTSPDVLIPVFLRWNLKEQNPYVVHEGHLCDFASLAVDRERAVSAMRLKRLCPSVSFSIKTFCPPAHPVGRRRAAAQRGYRVGSKSARQPDPMKPPTLRTASTHCAGPLGSSQFKIVADQNSSASAVGGLPSLADIDLSVRILFLAALKVIGNKLKKVWDFSVDPCSGSNGWYTPGSSTTVMNNVTCNCTFANGTVCHVVSMSAIVNRISGPIPKEVGNISTLQQLVLESNRLEGTLPPELGNLTSLTRLVLSSNYFTGELPSTFAKLANLKEMMIMGTSIEGPIPSNISTLGKLLILRISDLQGPGSKFPPLQNLTNLKELVLRNCSLSGEIPSYIGSLKSLQILDLSFNNLTGAAPPSLTTTLKDVFLSNNNLTGSLPSWYNNKINVDLSKNNFVGANSVTCQTSSNVNLLSSFSSTTDNSASACLRKDYPCSGVAKYSSLFLNCGGNPSTVNGSTYEGDPVITGDTVYSVSSKGNWAFTSTGWFMDNGNPSYTPTNTTSLLMSDPTLYMTARTSPITMTYYGLCLQNGNYNVSLHFAEIIFTNDQNYTSLGERVFDVYIQGKLVLSNFNIEKEAGGPGYEVVKIFRANVTENTLEINFYWAGKGTIVVPEKGVEGPLISAISVTPSELFFSNEPITCFLTDFTPRNYDETGRTISTAVIIVIVIASCVIIFMVLMILWLKFRRGKDPLHEELKVLKKEKMYFSFGEIKAATNNFDPANKIGEGGFGPVFKGSLPDGRVIAVKQLSSRSRQGNREFLNEISMISPLQHPNLVKLHGCCTEGNQLMLIYEYLENNCLARALFGPPEHRLKLSWRTRYNICLGIAKGLAYLHEESRLKIVHRDIKATNVLLDKDLNAKISDFGLAKLDEEEHTHISTRIAGTIGYMAPEYATRGYLTAKADVYSFGVVLLEIVSGQSNTSASTNEDFAFLLDRAYVLQESGELLQLVDPSLGSKFSKEGAMCVLTVALLCTSTSPSLRPTMSTIVDILEGRAGVEETSTSIGHSSGHSQKSNQLKPQYMSQDTMTQSVPSIHEHSPWTDTSQSVPDKGPHMSGR
ncbi:putative receptor-like protein kinase [Nymphaea thermarum]|nr:putative receptor-like protein kinase [Nymphaea thermarum]